MNQSPAIKLGDLSVLSILKSFKSFAKPKFTHENVNNSNYSFSSDSGNYSILQNDVKESSVVKTSEINNQFSEDCGKLGNMIINESVNSINSVEDSQNNDSKVFKRKQNISKFPSKIHLRLFKKVSKAKKMRKNDLSDSDCCSDNDSFERKENYSSDSDEDFSFKCKSSLQNKIIKFLNDSNETEFSIIPNMNAVKLQILISNRPYSSWNETVQFFENTKGINNILFKNICNVIHAKNKVYKLMKKCEELALETEQKISSGEILVSEAPCLLNPKYQLSSYQLIGLNWLALMRSRCLNSILADEMGLGKTIQVIAFLSYLKEKRESQPECEKNPHLIVVPSSTLENWYNEFQRWCPSMNVTIYHGNQEERRRLRYIWFSEEGFGDTEVVLTTYSCAINTPIEKKLFRKKKFDCIVFDEAHYLKNMNTQRYEALILFNGSFKILLTGTPLQNNLLELMSLLIFLMPGLFVGNVQHIKLLFSKYSKSVDENSSDFQKEKLIQAKHIIEPFMLRRLKEDVLRDLPKKTINVEKCSLLPDQQKKYDEILEELKFLDASKQTNNYYMTYFMMLRKIANHPLMLRYHFTEDKLEKISNILANDINYNGSNPEYIKEDLLWKSDYELHRMCQERDNLSNLQFTLSDDLICDSGKLQFLKSKLCTLKDEGHRVLIFSQFILMLDLLQEFCRVNNFIYLRLDGSTPTIERQEMIDLFNSDDKIFLFLLSTKAGGLGINLTAADTVIIHDIDFNPYNDKQAEDRCHRVGQKNCVQVIKLVSENTIEEKMYTSAIDKLCLEKQITTQKEEDISESKTIAKLLEETLGLH